MWLIVRYGVPEALEYLSKFCNFYVYSHGLRHYIDEILKYLDPDEKYFIDRDWKVLAPHDQVEQMAFVKKQKSLYDFKNPNDRSKSIFGPEDINKTLIIDDQWAAIKETDHLVISKKFLRFSKEAKALNQRKTGWRIF
jgi:hypothetical protein